MMSGKSSSNSATSAHNLLELSGTISGWLRRQGKLERISPELWNKVGLKWRHKFVVLEGGNLHIYNNETSMTPCHSSSLKDYNVVKRAIADLPINVPYSFKLEPLGEETKTHYFACTCLKEMTKWMNNFKREMMKAHNKPLATDPIDEEDYVVLEEPIMKSQPESKDRVRPPLPTPKDSDESSEYDSDDSDNYHEIDPEDMDKVTQGRALPVIPKEEKKKEKPCINLQDSDKSKTLPTKVPPPQKSTVLVKTLPSPTNTPPKPQQVKEKEFLFNNDDRNAAAKMLDSRTVGTFLVRNSRKSPDLKVLAVRTPDGVKEYQIYHMEGQRSLDKKKQFQNIYTLVTFYESHQLPTQPITLSRGYNTKE